MQQKNEDGLLHILEMIVHKLRFIIGFTSIITISAIVFVLLVDKKYIANGVILPEESESSLIGQFLKGGAVADFIGSSANGFMNNSAQTKAVLESERMARDVIDTFNLADVYKFSKRRKYYIEDLIREFTKHYGVNEDYNRCLIVSVEDKSPERAAAMVNFILRNMNRINTDVKTKHASQLRKFVRTQMDSAEQLLTIYEDSLELFMSQKKALAPEEQARVGVGNAYSLVQLINSKSLELDIAKKTYNRDHQVIKKLEMELQSIQSEANKLYKQDDIAFTFPMSKSAIIMKEYVRHQRRVEIQNTVFLFLKKMYEQIKYEEANTVPQIKILQEAYIPAKRAFPKRTRIVIGTMIASFFTSIILVLFMNYAKKYYKSNPETINKLKFILQDAKKVLTARSRTSAS